jgi:hypothetical protein
VLSLDALLGLCWHATDHVRLLVPPGESKSVGDVANRFIAGGLSWEGLRAGTVAGGYTIHPRPSGVNVAGKGLELAAQGAVKDAN